MIIIRLKDGTTKTLTAMQWDKMGEHFIKQHPDAVCIGCQLHSLDYERPAKKKHDYNWRHLLHALFLFLIAIAPIILLRLGLDIVISSVVSGGLLSAYGGFFAMLLWVKGG